MSDYTIIIEGDSELSAKLKKFGVAVLDLKPEFERTGTYLTRFFGGEVFTSRGRVIGKPWPALNPSYAAFKARRWPGRPPLVQTGLMQRSFKHRSTKLSTSLWNETQYFDDHQEGRGVPRRVMMLIDRQRERAVVSYVEEGVKRHMEATGV
jgi:hypothetical protein